MDEYEVEIAGIKHTLLLNPEDAKARGAKLLTKDATPPTNKARASKNKSA